MDKSILTIVLLMSYGCGASRDCDTFRDCETCTSHKSWSGARCRWCPLDRECHAYASLKNSCKVDQNIKSSADCPNIHKAYGGFNRQLAYETTLLSAIAYTDTPTKCMNSILPDGGFELIHAVGRRCEDFPLFEYKECYAYTAVSHTKKMIVLAYRGTTTIYGNQQLYDEIVSVLTTPKTSFLIGGEVQYYFKHAHDKLFPCVRNSIDELVRQNLDYQVVITGHSLGGAIASLSAASLIYTGVVAENKLSLYTFGMPRVGDKDYALNHDRIVYNSWRVVHGRDIVAHLPTCNLLLGCRVTANGPYHHRTEIFYKADRMSTSSEFIHCEGNEDDRCSDGLVTSKWCVPGVDLSECITYHKNYFGIPVGTYCNQNGARRKRSDTEHSLMWDTFSSDQCRRLYISNGSTVDADQERVTSNSISAPRKTQIRFLIVIPLMIFNKVFM